MAEASLGIIAGKGQFPLLLARSAKRQGYRVVAVAHLGETMPELEQEVDEITWIHLGQVGKLLKTFKKAGVHQAVMSGGVTKTRMFTDIKPDLKALTLVGRLRHMADDGILRTLASFMEDEGIRIRGGHELLPELLASEGVWTRRKLSSDELEDARIGWRVAAEIGRLDIGQSVVVRGRAVVAVEAVEGTDAAIRRGGALAREKAVVVKRCKPSQDERFDLPAAGEDTVKVMAEAGCGALVIEAGRTLVFDREAMVATADKHGIAVAAWGPGGDE